MTLKNCTITGAHTTPFGQQVNAVDCLFEGVITLSNNNVKWVTDGCDYIAGVVLSVGNPGWAFGGRDTFLSARAGLNASPPGGTWKVGARGFNPTPTIGQPKSRVCTVAGTPGTWVSEGNL